MLKVFSHFVVSMVLALSFGPVLTALSDEPAKEPTVIGYRYTIIKGGGVPSVLPKPAHRGDFEARIEGTRGKDQTLRLYKKGLPVGPYIPVKSRISALAVSPDGVTIGVALINSGGDYATVYAVDATTGEKIEVQTAGSDARPVFNMRFSEDGKTLDANVSDHYQK